MPHFTVTKVEDPEEGAAASVSQEGETSLAEVKARIQHSDEPGKYSTWEIWGLNRVFSQKRKWYQIFKISSSGQRKSIVVKVFVNQLFHSIVYLITSRFSHSGLFFPTMSSVFITYR